MCRVSLINANIPVIDPRVTRWHTFFFFFFFCVISVYNISEGNVPFPLIIFQTGMCWKRPWGLRVLAFVSRFPWVSALTLHLSSLLLSQLLPRPPPFARSVSARGQRYTFFWRQGLVFFTYCSLKIECDLKKVGVFKDIVVAAVLSAWSRFFKR